MCGDFGVLGKDCGTAGGGTGATLIGLFPISTDRANNNLHPGDTLRFIVGQKGQSVIKNQPMFAAIEGAGGGGGTAVVRDWEPILVAGGGGGGFGVMGVSSNGRSADSKSENGKYSEGVGGDGGSNGGSGYASLVTFASPGGGVRSNTEKYVSRNGQPGWSEGYSIDSGSSTLNKYTSKPSGGLGGKGGSNGGFGFGGGGSTYNSGYSTGGGGGGGYSGGGGSAYAGGGGGSYPGIDNQSPNVPVMVDYRSDGVGATLNPKDGYIEYQFLPDYIQTYFLDMTASYDGYGYLLESSSGKLDIQLKVQLMYSNIISIDVHMPTMYQTSITVDPEGVNIRTIVNVQYTGVDEIYTYDFSQSIVLYSFNENSGAHMSLVRQANFATDGGLSIEFESTTGNIYSINAGFLISDD